MARASQPCNQSQQPIKKRRRRNGILHVAKNDVGVHRDTPGEVSDQVFRHAHEVPCVGFLEVHKAGLKY